VIDFFGVTDEICDEAWSIVSPAVKSAARRGITNKDAGHVLVLNPSIPYEPKYHNALEKEGARFGELVLWDHSFGDSDSHDLGKYADIALRKAFVSFLTGLPSHLVQQQFPALYVPDMTKWGGSDVVGPGPLRLITAFSGVEWFFDQMISQMMNSAIMAICHREVRELMASDEAVIRAPVSGL
jgi:hypothetical protein